MRIDIAGILAGLAAILSAWSTVSVSRSKRRQKQTAATVEAARLQLEGWQTLMDGWQKQLAECRDSETRLITQLSSARTEIIALAKVVSGEFPKEIAAEMVRAIEAERSARLANDDVGGPSL